MTMELATTETEIEAKAALQQSSLQSSLQQEQISDFHITEDEEDISYYEVLLFKKDGGDGSKRVPFS
ncbi:hypothetical protein L6452_34412 [Arctium lappa]|uniref:Uncharacterized protein n=1 Tax=Arctium lappa TaxID=4217 RepID=A0ACB8YI89_ARCLA|nr:hypothetical protein L6452_34412 [Arctium lappa]